MDWLAYALNAYFATDARIPLEFKKNVFALYLIFESGEIFGRT